MNRVEWGVLAAIIMNVSTLIFLGGVVWSDIQDHERRVALLEAKEDNAATQLAAMNAKIDFLVEQAREARERRR